MLDHEDRHEDGALHEQGHRHEDGALREHEHDGLAHRHTHGVTDPTVLSSERGIWAVKWSLAGLMATAVVQAGVVALSGSVALLADTLHNFGDAGTAIPLWVAFSLARRRPNRRFTFGYGRLEDLAGVAIVLMILASALLAGYESVQRLMNPQPIQHLWAVALAALAGFAGNEGVALFRLRVGREIGSAALVADGYHARADGLASLSVLAGAAGVWAGLPLADPAVGLLISLAILRLGVESAGTIFTRLLDGVDPEVVEEIEETVRHARGVRGVGEVRVRWLGHRLRAEVNLAVSPDLSVREGHAIAAAVRHRLLHRLTYLSDAVIHVDPAEASGEVHHRIEEHTHDGSSPHSHG